MFGERQFCNFKKWDAQNVWGVQKMHRNFQTFENHWKSIWKCMFFCNRVPVQGVVQNTKSASPPLCRSLFVVFRAERGDPNSYKLWHLCGGGLLDAQSKPPLCPCGCALFQDPHCESAHYFSSVILVLEWGRLFFIKIGKIHLALQIPIWKRSRGQ